MEYKKGDDWKFLLFLLVLAFALRVFLVIYPEPIYNDGAEYIRQAKEYLVGNWTGGTPSDVSLRSLPMTGASKPASQCTSSRFLASQICF